MKWKLQYSGCWFWSFWSLSHEFIPHCSLVKIFVSLSMCNVGHDSVLKWHGSSKWSKCGDVWYYATLKVCRDKCKIQTLAGTGAHFIQETCPGHIAKTSSKETRANQRYKVGQWGHLTRAHVYRVLSLSFAKLWSFKSCKNGFM